MQEINDGYNHLREQVGKLAKIAMVRIHPGLDGSYPPGQPLTLVWTISPSLFFESREVLKDIPSFEVPYTSFAIDLREVRTKSPEQVADMVQQRFQCAVLSLWEFVGKDMRDRNMKRMNEHFGASP